MSNRRHLGRGNAATAIQGGKDLAQSDHLTADAGIPLYQGNLIVLISKV
jgi:hypothetical protein